MPNLDFIVDKGNIMNTNQSGGELAMLLTEDNGGTRLSSTRYAIIIVLLPPSCS